MIQEKERKRLMELVRVGEILLQLDNNKQFQELMHYLLNTRTLELVNSWAVSKDKRSKELARSIVLLGSELENLRETAYQAKRDLTYLNHIDDEENND